MDWKYLSVPLCAVCLVIGFMFGFYINIPKNITIDTGDNLKELSTSMENISKNFNDACHNLTFECNCDTYDMAEVNKKFSMLQSWYLTDWRNRQDDVAYYTYICMNRENFKNLDFTCKELYSIWGNSTT